ncbi:MAG TPA: hypothetical protein PK417_13470 [Hyphomonas sp.]|nr:hypothetical protein [Hyphomonas sp.]
MKYLLTGVAAIAMLTACGQKDKPGSDEVPSGIVFSESKIPEYKVQNGDAATAPAALAAMAFDTSGAGSVSWAKKELKGDKAVFTDVVLVSAASDEDDSEDGMSLEAGDDSFDLDGADLKAQKVEFEGLGMKNGQANFSRLVMSGVSLVPKDPEDAKNGSGTIGSIELVNPSPETAAWVAALFTDGDDHDLPKGAALAFDHWEMKDLDFRIDEPEGDKGTFTIKAIEVTGLKDQKAALMKLGGMAFDMTDGVEGTNMKMSLGSIEMHGADLALLSDASEDATDPEDVSKMMNLTKQDPANPGYESLTLNGFTMDMAGVKVDVPKLVSAVGHDKKNSVVAVKTDPFKVSLSTGEGQYGEQLGSQLATLGYETIELSGEGFQTYTPGDDVTTYVKGKNYWELKDGFRVDFSMAFAGAKAMAEAEQAQAQALSADPTAVLGNTLDKMILHDMEFAIDDNGFVDRAFNAYAAQSGEDPQEVRNQLTGLMAMAPMMAAGSGIDSELITEASTALSSFISSPKTLTIKLAPAEPLSMAALADMQDPSQLTKAKLGFEASNK